MNSAEQAAQVDMFEEGLEQVRRCQELIDKAEGVLELETLVHLRAQADQLRANIKGMLVKKISVQGKEQELPYLNMATLQRTIGPSTFLQHQLKVFTSKIRKLEPLGYSVKTMQQCQ